MDQVLRLSLLIALVIIAIFFTPFYATLYVKKSHIIEKLIHAELPMLDNKLERLSLAGIPFIGDHLKISFIFREHHFHPSLFPGDLERSLHDFRKFVNIATILYLSLIVLYLIVLVLR